MTHTVITLSRNRKYTSIVFNLLFCNILKSCWVITLNPHRFYWKWMLPPSRTFSFMNYYFPSFIYASFILFLSCINWIKEVSLSVWLLLAGVALAGGGLAPAWFSPHRRAATDRWWRGCSLRGVPGSAPAAPPCSPTPCCWARTETNSQHHIHTHIHTFV